jgi:hypothetical protein
MHTLKGAVIYNKLLFPKGFLSFIFWHKECIYRMFICLPEAYARVGSLPISTPQIRRVFEMKVWARSLSFVVSALILNVGFIHAHAGITGSDPRPPKTGVVDAGIIGSDLRSPETGVVVAGITGSDPRPPKTGIVVAGITGSDPRPPKTGVVVAGITGSDPRPPKTGVVVAGITGSDPRPPKTGIAAA